MIFEQIYGGYTNLNLYKHLNKFLNRLNCFLDSYIILTDSSKSFKITDALTQSKLFLTY